MSLALKTAEARLRHRLRFAQQMLVPPSTAVVGAYHYENVGDMALALAGLAHWPGPAHPALQTSANIAKWPGRPVTLVCGGAILTEAFVTQLRLRFGRRPSDLALIGVEISRQSAPLSEASLIFLSRLPFLALRNSAQASSLMLSGADDTWPALVPDIVFGLPRPLVSPVKNGRRVLGLNVKGGTGRDRNLTQAESDTVRRVQREFFRTVVENAADRGWQVEHVPFALRDDAAARQLLAGLPVRFAPFSADPAAVMGRMADMAAFAPSRYHALIFALRAGLPVTPFFYARKNYWLAEDFTPWIVPFGFREALDAPSGEEIRRHAERSYTAPCDHLAGLQERVAMGFRAAFAALGLPRVGKRRN